MTLYPVILSGGSGTRLWPLSREAYPKQLLPLASDRSLLQETVLRLTGLPAVADPLLVCNHGHRFLVAEQLRELDVSPLAIFLEPVGRNTAPAIAAAAYELLRRDEDAVMLVLPADHLILDVDAFQQAVARAGHAVADGNLVTFGIVPDRPETGYGYICQGQPLAGEGVYRVERFVEKPDERTASAYLAEGGYYWNSGMFLFQAKTYLTELEAFRPAIAQASREAMQAARADLDFVRLDETAFKSCPSESIDYAVMEHTSKAAVVPVDIGWSDIGSWSALWDTGGKDADGNVLRGDVFAAGVSNSFVRAESRIVAVLGISDAVIVETRDAVLVAHKDSAQDVKKVVEHLKAAGRSEHLFHTRVYRPWGWYEGIDAGARFQVKRIMVNPGAKLSLQMHHHRAEHWVVVTGTARITRDGETELVSENQSTYIPLGVKHRLENPGQIPLHLIEVQSGAYLGEDDIVRFEDVYRRETES
ncbi:MAG TPA: mannose-1-phosphate guanylyltransferase/mannose-6-phosphate isomerase [Methylococcaceae bacterium]|nr:mannose-1-phosphate guanylyltransferase/mannose-6-phosphate isomerase [Methylococcaceae bacterium]